MVPENELASGRVEREYLCDALDLRRDDLGSSMQQGTGDAAQILGQTSAAITSVLTV